MNKEESTQGAVSGSEPPPPSPQDCALVDCTIALIFKCPCGAEGLLPSHPAVQSVLFGGKPMLKCKKCGQGLALGMGGNMVIPVSRDSLPRNRSLITVVR